MSGAGSLGANLGSAVFRTWVISWRRGMLSLFRRLMRHTQGATAVEYTLITSLIAVAAIASMRSVSGKVNNVLGATATALN